MINLYENNQRSSYEAYLNCLMKLTNHQMVRDATFLATTSNGKKIESPCKINLLTHDVYGFENSEEIRQQTIKATIIIKDDVLRIYLELEGISKTNDQVRLTYNNWASYCFY